MAFDYKKFFKQVYERATSKAITSDASQVAFYFIFALFPLLLFVLTIIGFVLGAATGVKNELFGYLEQVMPDAAFSLIKETLNEVTDSESGGKMTFGALLALWSASAGVDNIRIALNDIYELKETRPWWKYKLTSLLMTLGIALLIFIALGVMFYGSPFINLLLQPLGISVDSRIILQLFSFVVVAIALVLAFALIYSFAPNHTAFTWQWISPGAVTAIILWIAVSGGFRIYLHYFNSYSKTYGSVGAIIVLLLWLYLTALAILIGGVVNSVADEFSARKNKAFKEKNKLSEAEKEAKKSAK